METVIQVTKKSTGEAFRFFGVETMAGLGRVAVFQPLDCKECKLRMLENDFLERFEMEPA